MKIRAVSREDAINLCKLGQSADCCIWLVGGKDGFECLYYNRSEGKNLLGQTLEERWKAGLTVAKRDGCEQVKESG